MRTSGANAGVPGARNVTQMRTWEERHDAARDYLLPWLRNAVPLGGARVLEWGCGEGPLSVTLAPEVKELIGLDIDVPSIDSVRRRTREYDNVTFAAGAHDQLIARARDLLPDIDLVILFAVLEHMTIDERLELLDLIAASPSRPYVMVAETPNRLLWHDYHTSELVFFGMLPDSLALRLVDQIPRDFVADQLRLQLARDPEQAPLALARLGRGVSFHEFELVFDDFAARVSAGNWDARLLPEREVHSEELAFARFLARVRPDLPATFARYYLDFVVAPTSAPRSLVRPWAFHTEGSLGVSLTIAETARIERGGFLRVDVGERFRKLVLGRSIVLSDARRLRIEAPAEGWRVDLNFPAPDPRGGPVYEEVTLPSPASFVLIGSDDAFDLSFVGWST